MNNYFDILLFTHTDKDESLLNFLGVLDKAEILGILDRHFMTYRKAMPVKEISKVGGGYPAKKVLVIDEKVNAKYYEDCPSTVMLIEGYHTQTKLARIGGKLVRIQDTDE